MNAIATRSVSQRALATTQPTHRICLRDSVVPMPPMDLKDTRQLSQFRSIIMLIPHPITQDADGSSRTVRSNVVSPVISHLHELFDIEPMLVQVRDDESDFTFGDARVRFSSMEASRKGEPVALKLKEFKTLQYFSRNVRRVISRDELLNEVWGYDNYPCTRTVDNHIWQLRRKFEVNPSRPVHFQTVHGVGYRFLP